MTIGKLHTMTARGLRELQTFYYVEGITGEYYATRMQAEVRAVKCFPFDDPRQRAGRIHTRYFREEV
jgi:hypothetical protein